MWPWSTSKQDSVFVATYSLVSRYTLTLRVAMSVATESRKQTTVYTLRIDRKLQRHRAVSLRQQYGFLVIVYFLRSVFARCVRSVIIRYSLTVNCTALLFRLVFCGCSQWEWRFIWRNQEQSDVLSTRVEEMVTVAVFGTRSALASR